MDFNTMLDDVYTQLGTNKSETMILPTPELDKGTTRVIWKNIKVFLKLTNTPPEHLFNFIEYHSHKKLTWFSESVSDGLIVHDKRFATIDVINIMKKYVEEFVICRICKKSNTCMMKDIELRKYKIKCNECNSDYIV